uniref:Uncharacterized protein n=1 Tax=Anguilla anguilla TaxID=7936 RepID=A0A0E9TNC5_ANGAN
MGTQCITGLWLCFLVFPVCRVIYHSLPRNAGSRCPD